MQRPAGEDEDWDVLGDDALREVSPVLDASQRGLFRRISSKRAAYFADIREERDSGVDGQEGGVCQGRADDFVDQMGAPGERQRPRSQGQQASGFADLSTWCCDAFAPTCASAHARQPAQAEFQLDSIAEQPTLIMPALAPETRHLADLPTEPLLVVVSRGKRGKKQPATLSRLCPGFLRSWLRGFKRPPQTPARESRKRKKPAAVTLEKKQSQRKPAPQARRASTQGEKTASATSVPTKKQIQPAGKEQKRQKSASKEQKQAKVDRDEQKRSAISQQVGQTAPPVGEQGMPGDRAYMLEKAKLDAKAEQEALVRNQERRASSKKGTQILQERLREREQRGDTPRTLTPPVLRPARISRPPTDNLFGK